MKKIVKTMIATMLVAMTTIVTSAIADEYNIIDPEQDPELYCLALNIYFEARGEPVEGQYAVADVTLNRVESSQFPDTICEVVYQCRRSSKCQFSWVHRVRNPHNPRILEREAWHDAQLYAYEIANWNVRRGITDGATYFHANYVRPRWRHSFELTDRIGVHLFYRDPRG
jgi:spore germination cell wall hydrolase CwlJ-like protein